MAPDKSLTRFGLELHSPDLARREEAARQLWLQFADRLSAVVRSRLDPRLARQAGVEDVVQSIFASFFAAAPGPNGPPRSREDLWRLLVHFTMCKVANTVDRLRAQRRDVFRERPMAGPKSEAGMPEPADFRLAGPEAEAIAREEFARLLAVLPEDLQEVFALKIEGWSNAEIAAEIGRVERTVELKMRTIRGLLQPHLDPAARVIEPS
jgi:DNA-directed RNA polymerase specialized sigma24 family protein